MRPQVQTKINESNRMGQLFEGLSESALRRGQIQDAVRFNHMANEHYGTAHRIAQSAIDFESEPAPLRA